VFYAKTNAQIDNQHCVIITQAVSIIQDALKYRKLQPPTAIWGDPDLGIAGVIPLTCPDEARYRGQTMV
jgi:hypothetical protein